MRKLDTRTEQKILKLNSKHTPPRKISKKLKISRHTIYNVLKRNGIVINGNRFNFNKKYDINESFFSKIDTAEKAYFLGWLFADGSMNDKDKRVTLGLQKKDRSILLKLIRLISPNAPLYLIKRKPDPKYHRQDLYTIRLHRYKIWNDLRQLGLYQNKSSTIKFPNYLQQKLIPHFIRGYFDGDGSLSFIKQKFKIPKYQCQIVCSPPFAKALQNYLKSLKINSYIIRKINTKKVVSLCLSSLFCLRFLHFLYENKQSLFLKRKFVKFTKILQAYLQTRSKINIATTDFFRENQIFQRYLNKNINLDNYWIVDTRKY